MRSSLLVFLTLSSVAGAAAAGEDLGERIRLPKPEADGELSVEQAIRQRRSVREFRRRGLSLADVSQLLWSAQGETSRDEYRAAPSAGALYPLEFYVVAGDVDGLVPGVYRYRPGRHDLVRTAAADRREELAAAALDQSWVRRAPAVLVIAAVYERTATKYGQRARRYVHMEVGHAAQNVYLQATARGLGTVMVGAFRDTQVTRVLDLPAEHEPLGLMPVGRRR